MKINFAQLRKVDVSTSNPAKISGAVVLVHDSQGNVLAWSQHDGTQLRQAGSFEKETRNGVKTIEYGEAVQFGFGPQAGKYSQTIGVWDGAELKFKGCLSLTRPTTRKADPGPTRELDIAGWLAGETTRRSGRATRATAKRK